MEQGWAKEHIVDDMWEYFDELSGKLEYEACMTRKQAESKAMQHIRSCHKEHGTYWL